MKNITLSIIFSLFFISLCQASPTYNAEISVDVTSSNVADAKKQALNEATRKGLNEVILTISTEETIAEMNKLNDNQIQHFISGIQVLMEKSSSIRYIANLKIEVNKEILTAFIKENNLPLIISQTQHSLIIPLLEKEDGSLDIWANDNIWRNAFLEKSNLQSGYLKFYNIEKNLGNISSIDATTIYNMTPSKFAELSSFNNTENIFVLKYSLKDNKVYIKSFPSEKIIETNIDTDSPSLMIDKILPLIKSDKKQITTTNDILASVEKFEIIYTYPNLSQWVNLKSLLEKEPLVENLKIISMANKKIHFNFIYKGILEKLQTTLSLNGYTLRNNGEYYVIN